MEANENNFFSAILIIAILIGVVLVYFIITILRYHRRYINLQKERIHAEIIIQENERKRIATDLHDSIGPLLSSVKLQINSIDVANDEDQRVINNAGKHLDEIIGSMRMVAEGVPTVEAAVRLAQRHAVEMPITTQMHAILHGTRKPAEAVRELMERTLTSE